MKRFDINLDVKCVWSKAVRLAGIIFFYFLFLGPHHDNCVYFGSEVTSSLATIDFNISLASCWLACVRVSSIP